MRKLQILSGNIDPNRHAVQISRHKHRRTSPTEWIEDDAIGGTRRKDGDFTQVFGVRGEMQATFLSVFWNDVPYIRRFAALGMISQKVEALFLQLFCSTGNTFGIRVGCPLLSANDHAEICHLSFLNRLQHPFKLRESDPLFFFTQGR